MKRTPGRLIVVIMVIASIAFFTVQAEETAAFSFRNGIGFGMNEAELKRIEAANGQVEPDAWESDSWVAEESNNWHMIAAKGNVEVSKYEARVAYILYHDQMQIAAYVFFNSIDDDEVSAAYDYLVSAMSSVYGESTQADPSVIAELMDCIIEGIYTESDISAAVTWQTDSVNTYQFYYAGDQFVIMYTSPSFDYKSVNSDTFNVFGL